MTYTYLCENCGLKTEIRCRISERKKEILCPNCKKVAKKMVEAPALVGVSSTVKRINKELTEKNINAGKRMRHSHKSFKD